MSPALLLDLEDQSSTAGFPITRLKRAKAAKRQKV
jgi:hypothetical protein